MNPTTKQLLLIANNIDWQTMPFKKDALIKWFAPVIDLVITEIKTNVQDIPFVPYNSGDDNQNKIPNIKGIDPVFYDKHFSPLAKGYDIVLVVLPNSQWPYGNNARGWRADRTYGAIELQIACDENERLYWFGKDDGDMFFQLARHEILHALYMAFRLKDTVHYWWNQDPSLLDKCLLEIKEHLDKVTLLERLLDLYKKLLAILIKPMSINDELVKLSLNYEGKDFTDDKVVPDEVSCVYAVSTLLHEQDNRVPIMDSTKKFDEYLSTSPLFRKVTQPIQTMKAGWIVNSPTGSGTRPDLVPIGHTGIYVDENVIMSNSSESGLWTKNYTRESWRKRFGERGGMPIRIYEKVV